MLKPAFSGTGPSGALKVCMLCGSEYYPWDPSRFMKEYTWELYFLNRGNSMLAIRDLARRDFDIFFNFCDSSWHKPFPGIEVIRALEQAEVAFTGADSAFFSATREDMKRVCRQYGIHAPESVEASVEADIERAAATLHFPLIVKSIDSFGSIGIRRASRVKTPGELRKQAHRVMHKFGAALIEEFIEGREFTVLVAENPEDPFQPKVYRPVEWIFPPGESFKHYKMKWVISAQMPAVPLEDPVLSERLMVVGRKLFVGMNGVSYGRCDVRVNPAGEIFVLEINAQSSLFDPIEDPGDTDFVLFNDPDGHRGFVELLFKAALARNQRLRRKWVARHNPGQGYSLYARQSISAGEVILPSEKRPLTLVSLRYVQQNWPPEQQHLFAIHSYPLTDELWVVPSEDPADWSPINHSCDPNAWWDGLNIVARRPISEAEEITLEYATFHNELMPDFACSCQSQNCRLVIRGTDFLLPFMDCFEGHVSDYIRRRRFS